MVSGALLMRPLLSVGAANGPLALVCLLVLGGCAAAGTALPPARTVIVHSGARLRPTAERMDEIAGWSRAQRTNIIEDPSFFINPIGVDKDVYPWEGLELKGDTADVAYNSTSDGLLPYEIYAHLHLMKKMERIAPWLPDAPDSVGFELERAILARVSDVWLYGRSVFSLEPHRPLDELVYSTENGFLDAFILTARPEEFEVARAAWVAENPNRLEAYRAWFKETFDDEPPGLRGEEGDSGGGGGR